MLFCYMTVCQPLTAWTENHTQLCIAQSLLNSLGNSYQKSKYNNTNNINNNNMQMNFIEENRPNQWPFEL